MVGLFCSTSPSGSFNWYHTLDPAQAGISGDLIINDGNPYTLDSIFGSNSLLTFTVSNNTIGFYWCVITSYTPIPLRPSTITPICMNYNNSLSECPQSFSLNDQHRTISECADENILFTRAHLPTNCIPYQSPSYTLHLNTSTSVHNILTSIVPTTTAAGISSVSLFSSTSFIKQFSFTASSTQVPTAVDDDNKVIIFVSTGVFVILITVSVILFVIICSICYCRVHQSQKLDDIAGKASYCILIVTILGPINCISVANVYNHSVFSYRINYNCIACTISVSDKILHKKNEYYLMIRL